MKSVLLNILSLCIIITAFSANAQNSAQSSKWMSEVKAYKHEMLVKETGMTAAQREEFLPLYMAMENEIYQVNRDAHTLENKVAKNDKATDSDFNKAATSISQVKAKEAEIENRYYQKFAKILSKKQLFQLKHAENKFARDMITHSKRGNKK